MWAMAAVELRKILDAADAGGISVYAEGTHTGRDANSWVGSCGAGAPGRVPRAYSDGVRGTRSGQESFSKLIEAAQNGDVKMAASNRRKWMALHHAARRLLLARGAPVDMKNIRGETPLHLRPTWTGSGAGNDPSYNVPSNNKVCVALHVA